MTNAITTTMDRVATEHEQPTAEPLLLRAANAAALCQTSLRTWRAWDITGKIPPPIRMGRSIYWRPNDLRQWVDAGCPDRETWAAMQQM